jgi:hypothetical protein
VVAEAAVRRGTFTTPRSGHDGISPVSFPRLEVVTPANLRPGTADVML